MSNALSYQVSNSIWNSERSFSLTSTVRHQNIIKNSEFDKDLADSSELMYV